VSLFRQAQQPSERSEESHPETLRSAQGDISGKVDKVKLKLINYF